jgi:hypothetical protein
MTGVKRRYRCRLLFQTKNLLIDLSAVHDGLRLPLNPSYEARRYEAADSHHPPIYSASAQK